MKQRPWPLLQQGLTRGVQSAQLKAVGQGAGQRLVQQRLGHHTLRHTLHQRGEHRWKLAAHQLNIYSVVYKHVTKLDNNSSVLLMSQATWAAPELRSKMQQSKFVQSMSPSRLERETGRRTHASSKCLGSGVAGIGCKAVTDDSTALIVVDSRLFPRSNITKAR